MATKKVIPGSLTQAYKKGEGDFSPDLVGFQLTKGTPLLTLGNFSVTTNNQPKVNNIVNTGVFSDPYTLETLNLTNEESQQLVSNDVLTTLNVDITNITRFVYYGSFLEFLRVNVEEIILNWKGSLYITDGGGPATSVTKITVLGYNYDGLTDESTFLIPTQFIVNNFNLDYELNDDLLIDAKDISNLSNSFTNYEISNDYGQFDVLGFTGSTDSNPYVTILAKGEVFPTLTSTSFGTFDYHVKPKDNVVEILFYQNLSDFGNILLNRLTLPKFTATLEAPIETESGRVYLTRQTYTWPTTDGYNLDVDTTEYGSYLSGLLKLGDDYDRLKSDLISRRFVSTTVKEFDTASSGGDDTEGRKIQKLLRIYGREFDEVKKYTDSIQFSKVVTYNKKDNIPDELIKMMAKTLGFETLQTVTNNSLASYLATKQQTPFSGHSREMSTKEVDTELWRRLVINAWWLYKSKGARKVIEFFFKLFGLPDCLVNFDELLYVVKDKLNREETFLKIKQILSKSYGIPITDVEIDEDRIPMDSEGFPKTLPNTPEYYYQMYGYWYNNDKGPLLGTDKVIGNNPHFGPYDYGNAYYDPFRCFISDFSGITNNVTKSYIESVNLFNDYNKGTIESFNGSSKPLQDYGLAYANVMNTSNRVSPIVNLTQAGYSNETSRTGQGALKFTFNLGEGESCAVKCPPLIESQQSGLWIISNITDETLNKQVSLECCDAVGGWYGPSGQSFLEQTDAQTETNPCDTIIPEAPTTAGCKVGECNPKYQQVDDKKVSYNNGETECEITVAQFINTSDNSITDKIPKTCCPQGYVATYYGVGEYSGQINRCLYFCKKVVEENVINITDENTDVDVEKFCYWCPPDKKFCEPFAYYRYLYDAELNEILYSNLKNDFWLINDKFSTYEEFEKSFLSNTGTFEKILAEFERIYKIFADDWSVYSEYCVINNPDGESIINPKCCTLRGGQILNRKDFISRREEEMSTKPFGEGTLWDFANSKNSQFNIKPKDDVFCVIPNDCPEVIQLSDIPDLSRRCCDKKGYNYLYTYDNDGKYTTKIYGLSVDENGSRKVIRELNTCELLKQYDCSFEKPYVVELDRETRAYYGVEGSLEVRAERKITQECCTKLNSEGYYYNGTRLNLTYIKDKGGEGHCVGYSYFYMRS